MNTARRYLELAQAPEGANPLDRIADALTGILAAVVDADARQDREDTLVDLHDKADAALARVLDLAADPDLPAHIAHRIRDAVDSPTDETTR